MTRPDTKCISTWKDLARLAETYADGKWLFRGVTKQSYELIPKVGREDLRHDGLTNKIRPFKQDEERRLLEAFKLRAWPYITYTPVDDIEWMALGQHHGLATRLLDWSESLLVAGYFATEYGDVNQISRIYCVKEFEAYNELEKPDVFSITQPYVYRPPHIAARIPAQQAIFTVHHKPERPLAGGKLDIEIIDIPGRSCISLKRMLDVAGFNRASLYPDIDGLGAHLSWRYKWNWRL